MNKIALDTNVLIYLHDAAQESVKRAKANALVATRPYISSQVISEYLNVCQKRLKMSNQDAMDALLIWLPHCELCLFERDIFTDALRLMNNYQFQAFDAIIESSALISGCSVLYSEDMHHNLLIEKQLRIVNPFI